MWTTRSKITMSKKLFLVASPLEAKVFEGLDIEVRVIDIGILNAALNSYQMLKDLKPGLCVLVGIGGSYDEKKLGIGDVAIAEAEVWADFGRRYPEKYTLIPGLTNEYQIIKLDCSLIKQAKSLLKSRGIETVSGTFSTVCACSFDTKRAKFFKDTFKAILENMEGFGVALAAKKLGIPLLEVRVVSNLLEHPEMAWEFDSALNTLREVVKCLKDL